MQALPCGPDGRVDIDATSRLLDDRVRWLSLTWLPANSGLIHDAVALGRLARQAGVPYFIDAGQAVGPLPVDVRLLDCDALKSAGGKLLRGPRGTALLYVRSGFAQQLEPPWVDVQSAPWLQGLQQGVGRLESAEQPVALWLGLHAALRQTLALGADHIATRVQELAAQLRERLADVPGVVVRDESQGPLSGLVSFTVEGWASQAVKARLAGSGIRLGANGVPYTPWDMQARSLDGIVRASVSYLNDSDDLNRLTSALAEL